MGTTMFESVPSTTCAQSHPGSSLHVAEQPSPERVLPSSHSSSGSLRPSPQGEVQPLVPVQMGSDLQSGAQPSPGMVLPSSHDSLPSLLPSPQTVLWQASLGLVQANPGSTLHASVQPSPDLVLPSSHSSQPVR